jgi:bile acid:Na+ symporter, BASS family
MEVGPLITIGIPIALILAMLGMGLSLVPDDFRRVVRYPKAVCTGIVLQMLALPVLAFGIVTMLGLTGALAVGVIAIALAPGGSSSNLISFLAGGDVALSVTLTAVVSLITPFTIPLVLGPAIAHFMGEHQALALPWTRTIVVLVAMTIIPVGLGLVIRHFAPAFSIRAERYVRIFAIALLVGLIVVITGTQWEKLPTFIAQAGLADLLLNVCALAIGFAGARMMRLERRQAISIGIEVGIQNGATALFVTGTLIGNPTMSIGPAVYGLFMYGTGALFGFLVGTKPSVEPEVQPQ